MSNDEAFIASNEQAEFELEQDGYIFIRNTINGDAIKGKLWARPGDYGVHVVERVEFHDLDDVAVKALYLSEGDLQAMLPLIKHRRSA